MKRLTSLLSICTIISSVSIQNRHKQLIIIIIILISVKHFLLHNSLFQVMLSTFHQIKKFKKAPGACFKWTQSV